MALFCKHEYKLMRNPKSTELIGIWIDGWGQVYNKKICKKCNKIKKFAISEETEVKNGK